MKKVTLNGLKPSDKEFAAYAKCQFYKLICFVKDIGAKNIKIDKDNWVSFDFDRERRSLYLHSTFNLITCWNGEYYEVSYIQQGRRVVCEFCTIPLENCFSIVALFLGYDLESGRLMTRQEKKGRFGDLCLNGCLRYSEADQKETNV